MIQYSKFSAQKIYLNNTFGTLKFQIINKITTTRTTPEAGRMKVDAQYR